MLPVQSFNELFAFVDVHMELNVILLHTCIYIDITLTDSDL